jgi:hypothetical protein
MNGPVMAEDAAFKNVRHRKRCLFALIAVHFRMQEQTSRGVESLYPLRGGHAVRPPLL